MKTIELTQNQVACVDDEDFENLSRFKWHAQRHHNRKGFYASRRANYKTITMHGQILGLWTNRLVVDHIDGNGLNNTRANLRIATYNQNCQNIPMRNSNTSGYRGVQKAKAGNRWFAIIGTRGKAKRLGTFDTREEAARAYDAAAIAIYGPQARVNFP